MLYAALGVQGGTGSQRGQRAGALRAVERGDED